MSKYNLMDNEQPEFFDQYFEDDKKKSADDGKDKKRDHKPESPYLESDMAEKIFDDDAISQLSRDKEELPDTKLSDDADSAYPLIEQEKPLIEQEEPQDSGQEIQIEESDEPLRDITPSTDESYETETELDYRQPGLSYKPILIGIGILAAVAVIYFLVSTIFFGDTKETPEKIAESPEEKLMREQALQKERHLSIINNTNGHYLSYITSLFDMISDDIQYSSVLLYDKSIYFEIFAGNRDKLAQFNMQLKNNNKIPNYKIESVSTRPGTKGGIFALYDIHVSESVSAGAVSGINTVTMIPSKWVESISQRHALKLQKQRQISNRKENLFNVSRMEFILAGAENKCQDLINQIVKEKSNFRVHKLSLVPTNQRDMAKSPYQFTLVLDFYI
jgi:hypothetical protein